MAATLDIYPVTGDPIVRGDPLTIVVRFPSTDVTGWTWRAHVRNRPDSRDPVTEFAVEADPDDDTQVLLSLTADETRLLQTGMGFDLEQLTPVQRTWLVVRALSVERDFSWVTEEVP